MTKIITLLVLFLTSHAMPAFAQNNDYAIATLEGPMFALEYGDRDIQTDSVPIPESTVTSYTAAILKVSAEILALQESAFALHADSTWDMSDAPANWKYVLYGFKPQHVYATFASNENSLSGAYSRDNAEKDVVAWQWTASRGLEWFYYDDVTEIVWSPGEQELAEFYILEDLLQFKNKLTGVSSREAMLELSSIIAKHEESVVKNADVSSGTSDMVCIFKSKLWLFGQIVIVTTKKTKRLEGYFEQSDGGIAEWGWSDENPTVIDWAKLTRIGPLIWDTGEQSQAEEFAVLHLYCLQVKLEKSEKQDK